MPAQLHAHVSHKQVGKVPAPRAAAAGFILPLPLVAVSQWSSIYDAIGPGALDSQHKAAPMATRHVLILSAALGSVITPDVFIAANGAEVMGSNRRLLYDFHLLTLLWQVVRARTGA